MKEKITVLVNFQSIEDESDRLKDRLEQFPGQLDQLQKDIAASEALAEGAAERLTDLKQSYRRLESNVQANIDLIKKNEAKLGTVKNNKEYQSILKGVDDIKQKNSDIEDGMLQYLDEIEDAERDMADRKEAMENLCRQIEIEQGSIESEADQCRRQLAALQDRKQQVAAGIDSELMRTYRAVKSKVRYLPVAAAVGEICQGCNLNIPPQLSNELQRLDRLRFCPHCQRIIYWKDASS